MADGAASEAAAAGEAGSRASMELESRVASEDAFSMLKARADDDFFF